MGESELEERVRKLEVRIAMTEQHISTVAQDVKDIKNTLTWLNRIVIAAIVAAGLNIILQMG